MGPEGLSLVMLNFLINILMKKKEVAKFVIQTVINLLAAVLTALGASSCMR